MSKYPQRFVGKPASIQFKFGLVLFSAEQRGLHCVPVPYSEGGGEGLTSVPEVHGVMIESVEDGVIVFKMKNGDGSLLEVAVNEDLVAAIWIAHEPKSMLLSTAS